MDGGQLLWTFAFLNWETRSKIGVSLRWSGGLDFQGHFGPPTLIALYKIRRHVLRRSLDYDYCTCAAHYELLHVQKAFCLADNYGYFMRRILDWTRGVLGRLSPHRRLPSTYDNMICPIPSLFVNAVLITCKTTTQLDLRVIP